MANMCWNNVAYYGDDIGEILKLYLTVQNVIIKEKWKEMLIPGASLIDSLGGSPSLLGIDTRTDLMDFGLVCENDIPVGVKFSAESAWSPCVELAEAILALVFPEGSTLKMVYMAEEPGFEIYINTDINHLFFDTVLTIDVDCDEGSDTVYYSYKKDDLQKAFDFIERMSGCRPTSLDDLKNVEFLTKIDNGFQTKHPDDGDYLSIHVYEES